MSMSASLHATSSSIRRVEKRQQSNCAFWLVQDIFQVHTLPPVQEIVQSRHALVLVEREILLGICIWIVDVSAFTCPEVKHSSLSTFGFFIAHYLGDVAFVLGDYLTTYHVVSRL